MFLILPYPPSVNTYWGFSGSRRYLTTRAVAFKNEVFARYLESGYKPFGGIPLEIKIKLHPKDNRIRDIDNGIKSLLDALCQAGIFTDDSQIQKLEIEKSSIAKGGLCSVLIEPYQK